MDGSWYMTGSGLFNCLAWSALKHNGGNMRPKNSSRTSPGLSPQATTAEVWRGKPIDLPRGCLSGSFAGYVIQRILIRRSLIWRLSIPVVEDYNFFFIVPFDVKRVFHANSPSSNLHDHCGWVTLHVDDPVCILNRHVCYVWEEILIDPLDSFSISLPFRIPRIGGICSRTMHYMINTFGEQLWNGFWASVPDGLCIRFDAIIYLFPRCQSMSPRHFILL